MRNITLKLKNLKDPEKVDIIVYANALDGYSNNAFFVIFLKEKNRSACATHYDCHYYPTHLILKVESEYTAEYGSGSLTIEKSSIPIEEMS